MMQLQVFHTHKRYRLLRRWGVPLVVLLIVIAVVGYQLWSPGVTTAELHSPAAATDIEEPANISSLPQVPARLVIPAIGVDALVQSIGLTADEREMDVPSNFTDVGWYELGVRPGGLGSAVMAGHLNGKHVPEAVFYDLDKLQIGDEVQVVNEAGGEDIFVVTHIEAYAYDDPTADVFVSSDGKARLNLITCGGEWLADKAVYDTRVVVFTELQTL